MILLVCLACGGGGAVLPTEAGTGGPPGGDVHEPPPENPGGGDGGGDGQPVSVTVTASDDGFLPASVTVPTGSTVTWLVVDGRHDVTFVGSTPAGGSIGETREGESASRTFDEAGTYEYHCARHADDGEAGVVVVEAGDGGDPEDPDDPGDPLPGAVTVTTPGDSFSPATATIAAGGTVAWQISGDEHNVTFTGAAPPGGNIPDTEGATVSRTFPDAGRYDYFCTRHSGMNGAVVVQ